jgi:hypothetical protein
MKRVGMHATTLKVLSEIGLYTQEWAPNPMLSLLLLGVFQSPRELLAQKSQQSPRIESLFLGLKISSIEKFFKGFLFRGLEFQENNVGAGERMLFRKMIFEREVYVKSMRGGPPWFRVYTGVSGKRILFAVFGSISGSHD